MKYVIIAFSSLLFFSGCADNGVESTGVTGTYHFVGYDGKSLRVVHQGRLTITIQDSTAVSGEWQFNSQQTEQLVGEYQSGTLSLDLNPGFADNNMFLRGTLQGRTYRGEWTLIGFAGVMGQGTFVAERK